MGLLDAADVKRIAQLLAARRPADRGARPGRERYLELMGHDKKVEDGKMRLILLERSARLS